MVNNIFYLHGMGGSPADWDAVRALVPGTALSIDSTAPDPVACAVSITRSVEAQEGSYCLCGYSMGGRLAVLAAQKLLARGRAPSALVLLAAGMGGGSDADRAERNRSDAEWAALAERDAAAFWERWYAQPLFASFHALPAATREAWLATRRSLAPALIAAQLRNLGPSRHEDLTPVLRALVAGGVRVLYLAGSLDSKYSALAGILGAIKGVQSRIVPGAGHILPLEAPAEVARALGEFLLDLAP